MQDEQLLSHWIKRGFAVYNIGGWDWTPLALDTLTGTVRGLLVDLYDNKKIYAGRDITSLGECFLAKAGFDKRGYYVGA